MKCPKCEKQKSTVMETRTAPDGVYRRRVCRGCGHIYISQETAPPDLKMPSETLWRARKRDATKKPGQAKFDTSHLNDVFR